MLRDLAHITADTRAPLAEKVGLYLAAAVVSPHDRARLNTLLEAAQRRADLQPVAVQALPEPLTALQEAADAPTVPDTPNTPADRARRALSRFEAHAQNDVAEARHYPAAAAARTASRTRSHRPSQRAATLDPRPGTHRLRVVGDGFEVARGRGR